MAKKAEESGEKIPRWELKVDYVESCNCNFGCPCNFSGYPTDGLCDALVGYHIRQGHFGRTRLDGLGGALLLGAHHGLYCAGCCASLMVVLLVVGVMNVGWMVALSALIYLEKVLPAGGLVGRLAGLVLCAAGAARMLG